MKAAIWIAFLLFAAAMAGLYHYYTNQYKPKQEALAKAQAEATAEMQAAAEAEKAETERRKEQAAAEAANKNPDLPEVTGGGEDIKMNIPKAKVVSTGSQTIKTSIYKKKKEDKPKTPEEIAREKELAQLRLVLRAAQEKANSEKPPYF